MFEKASKMKLRFTTSRGQVTTEDLWDFPLTSSTAFSLDSIAQGLSKSIKASAEESFVIKKCRANKTLELQLDIVKHIISVKLDEAKARRKAAETSIMRDKALAILAERQDEGLNELSDKELKKLARG